MLALCVLAERCAWGLRGRRTLGSICGRRSPDEPATSPQFFSLPICHLTIPAPVYYPYHQVLNYCLRCRYSAIRKVRLGTGSATSLSPYSYIMPISFETDKSSVSQTYLGYANRTSISPTTKPTVRKQSHRRSPGRYQCLAANCNKVYSRAEHL
jgi:hypothetical protein